MMPSRRLHMSELHSVPDCYVVSEAGKYRPARHLVHVTVCYAGV